MPVTTATNLDYLIDMLRLQLGDTDATAYRYLDEWLRTSLIGAVRLSQRWLNNKYLLDASYNIYRNTNTTFLVDSPPIIEDRDERVFILMASIMIKQGAMENASWSTVSWKDAEISFSNLEGSRSRDSSIKRDWDELTSLVKIPTKRLAWIVGYPLAGYKGNNYETNTEH